MSSFCVLKFSGWVSHILSVITRGVSSEGCCCWHFLIKVVIIEFFYKIIHLPDTRVIILLFAKDWPKHVFRFVHLFFKGLTQYFLFFDVLRMNYEVLSLDLCKELLPGTLFILKHIPALRHLKVRFGCQLYKAFSSLLLCFFFLRHFLYVSVILSNQI